MPKKTWMTALVLIMNAVVMKYATVMIEQVIMIAYSILRIVAMSCLSRLICWLLVEKGGVHKAPRLV